MLENTVLDQSIPTDKYMISKFNLLKNSGKILDDKISHRYYPPRINMEIVYGSRFGLELGLGLHITLIN